MSAVLRRRARAAFVATAWLIAYIAPLAQAAPGDIDLSFGSNGQTRIAAFVSTTYTSKGALIVEPNGSIVMAGACEVETGRAACLARVLADGAVDPSFGNNGLALGPVGISDKQTTGLARQFDGKYVVSSICEDLTGYYFCARRFTAAGGIDTTFGNNGAANLARPLGASTAFVDNIAANPDGTLLLMGRCGPTAGGEICLLRLLPNGQPDPSFGGAGYVRRSLLPTVLAFYNVFGFNPLPDGRVQLGSMCDLAGGLGLHYCIARLTTSGQLDATFNSTGPLAGLALKPRTLDYNADVGAMARRGDASVMLAVNCRRYSPSTGPDELCLESFTADGRIDTTFANAGERRITPSAATSTLFASQLLSSTDGRLVLAGRCGTASASAVPCINRYRADGTLDASFTAALLSTQPAPHPDSSGLGVQASGKIVFGGACSGGLQGFCITRILSGPFDYAQCSADVDGDGDVTVNDSLLLSRAALGFAGDALVQNITFASHAQRKTWPKIRDYLFNQCGMQVSP